MGRESRRRRERKAETKALRALYEQQANPTSVVRQIQIHASEVSGPIPSAEQLAAYGELVDPSLPGKIVEWAEQEGEHRRFLEKAAVAAEIDGAVDLRNLAKRGQWFGLILGLTSIAGGVAMVGLAKGSAGEIGGVALSGVGLASLIWGPRRAEPRTTRPDSD